MSDDTIVVTGKRSRGFGMSYGSWEIAQPNINYDADSGGSGISSQEIIPQDTIEIVVNGTHRTVTISRTDWNKLPSNFQFAYDSVFQSYKHSAINAESLQLFEDAEADIIVVVGRKYTAQKTGHVLDFPPGARALIDYVTEDPNSITRTDVKKGSTVYIYINENWLEQHPNENIETYSNLIVHELRHPYVADTPGGNYGLNDPEHHQVYDDAMEAVRQMWNGKVPVRFEAGNQITGSSASDTVTGGTNSDVLAGLGGSDILTGGGGKNVLYGGIGSDILVSEGVEDFLSGGLEGDTYRLLQEMPDAIIEDIGGADRVSFLYNYNDYDFSRVVDDLVIRSRSAGLDDYGVYIKNHFSGNAANQIEVFQFAGQSYFRHFVEDLAYGNQPGGGGGGGIYSPIILDLDGDGMSLLDADKSKIILDVEGDGSPDHVSWIDNSDGALVLDRNGDGIVTNASEMSFVNDLIGAQTDADGLLAFDNNGDGIISSADENFEHFMIWVDRNNDGQSTHDEMASLTALGILSIDLDRRSPSSSVYEENGSRVTGHLNVETILGNMRAYDIGFAFSPAESPSISGDSRIDYSSSPALPIAAEPVIG